jgi:hypothetical protein
MRCHAGKALRQTTTLGLPCHHKYISFLDAAEVANWYFLDGQYEEHELENM